MPQKKVAIVGATGAVGREMIKVLEERDFPVGELRLIASERSKGKKIKFRGEDITVETGKSDIYSGIDFVFGATDAERAKSCAGEIVKAGAVFIDNSSAFRLCPGVPLVIPEINAKDANLHNGIISNPNCSTIIALMAVAPIARLSRILKMVASTYQAASGAGSGGITELKEQIRACENGTPPKHSVFPCCLAYNIIPSIGAPCEGGHTREELKMRDEGRKILHLPALSVTCTCVRVPVLRSHSVSVSVVTENHLGLDEIREAIRAFPGDTLADDTENGVFPTPSASSGKDDVAVGRIRIDQTEPNGIALFCCGDQLRKGAATNAIQIAQLLI